MDTHDGDYPLEDLILSGLSIFRWNTFPRLRNITTLDHLGFVAHISLLIAHARGEKEGVYFDINLLLKKILFSGFFTFFYSDISAEVKDHLREESPDISRALDIQVIEKLTNLGISDRMMEDILKSQEQSPEDDIIAYAKMWASYQEIRSNARVYPEAYARLLSRMKEKSRNPAYSVFLPYLEVGEERENPLEHYLLVIQRLASSFRWNRSVRKYPISVLSHTFVIAFFTYMITCEEEILGERQSNMILTALFHDIPEAITGDIITPTKKSVPGLEDILEKIEHDMVHEQLISYIEEYDFSKIYARKMLHPWQESDGALVKKADTLSAFHEARMEAPYSEHFMEVYTRMKNNIKT